MSQKVIKKTATPSGANTAAAPAAESKTPAPKPVAEIARQAAEAASRASNTAGARGLARVNTSSAFATPPQGAHPPKGVPDAVLTLIKQRAEKDGAAMYVAEVPGKRGHHVLVAIGAGGEVATHGGCVRPNRAADYAALHAKIYGLPINASLANEEVRGAVKLIQG